jgi:hypothetical protein
MNNNWFDTSTSICSDDCWKTAKELHNNKIADYNLLPNNFVTCENPNVRMTEGYLEHPNLRGRPGYGLADDCLIDNDSMLRNNPDGLTHDKCRIQLNNRIFTSGPSLRCGAGNVGEELNLIEGTNTNPFMCKKQIMEKEMNNFIPLLDFMKDIQDPNNIVPVWTNGGEDTRSYIHRAEFNKNCNWVGRNKNMSV